MADVIGLEKQLPKQELPPVEESSVEADEKAQEQLAETEETFLEEEPAEALVTNAAERTPTTPAPVAQIVTKDSATIEVEKIMEEGLGSLYASLPEDAKPIFQKKGEEAAKEIAIMVRTFKLKLKRVLELLRNWLLTIPNVNKFFLEQEAKLKTDKIVELVEARKQDAQNRT